MKWWKVALIVVVIVIGIALLFLALWKIPELLVRGYHGRLDTNAISKLTPQEYIQLQKDLITAENDARATFAQILGGIGLLIGLYFTYRSIKVAHKNVEVAEEGKLTERFSKAVELLGSEKLDVRLGGIYALERIARDSQKDHWTVMEVLTAFIREQSKKESTEWKGFLAFYEAYMADSDPDSEAPEYKYPADIQAALTVIGRREWIDQEKRQGQCVDLSGAFLATTSLSQANFSGANFASANLSRVSWSHIKLDGAVLIKANLNGSFLIKADLSRAELGHADLEGANLHKADLSGAILVRASLVGANLEGANLKAVNLKGAFLYSAHVTWEQISQTIIDEKTKLPPEHEERRKAEQAKAAAQNQ
jgi:Pentapeptide repeats (8 copies)